MKEPPQFVIRQGNDGPCAARQRLPPTLEAPCIASHASAMSACLVSLETAYRPGAIGRITELHADYYSQHAGFGLAFERLVAQGLCDFMARYQPGRDGVWLLVREGHVEGSVVIDGLHAQTQGAHLRWFIVSDAVRGQGLGRSLLRAAMDFCRNAGYTRTFLWTFEGLHAARHLYEAEGFALVHEAPGSQWGREVREQRFEWVRTLV